MLIIGLDYTPAYEQGGGIGRYVRELVAALARIDTTTAYRLFVAGASLTNLPAPPGPNFEWRVTPIPPRWLARFWYRARIPYPIERWLGDVDLFHATDFVLPPTRHRTRTLLTVHDLSFIHVPEATSPRLRRYLNNVVPRSVRRADHILADSQATKDDLVSLYGTPEGKITVLLSGVGEHFRPVTDVTVQAAVRARYGLDTWPFLFTVGTVQPRKNYARICEALYHLRSRFPDLHLVIAGGKGWLEDQIYATVNRLHMTDRVHFIGFADEADLPVLYSMAEAVPYVSLYEGFGLPVLEAMACGTPVIASNVSSIPEVAGEAAILIDPYHTDELVNALRHLLESPALRQSLIERGRQQAARFSWKTAARQLADIYERTLAL